MLGIKILFIRRKTFIFITRNCWTYLSVDSLQEADNQTCMEKEVILFQKPNAETNYETPDEESTLCSIGNSLSSTFFTLKYRFMDPCNVPVKTITCYLFCTSKPSNLSPFSNMIVEMLENAVSVSNFILGFLSSTIFVTIFKLAQIIDLSHQQVCDLVVSWSHHHFTETVT